MTLPQNQSQDVYPTQQGHEGYTTYNTENHSNLGSFTGGQVNPGYSVDQSHLGYPGNQAHPGYPVDQPHPGYPVDQPHPGYPGNQAHPGYPGNQAHPGHPGNQAHPGYPRNQVHPGYPGNQAHPGYPVDQPHPGYPVDPGYPGNQVHRGYPGNHAHPGYPVDQSHLAYPVNQGAGYSSPVQSRDRASYPPYDTASSGRDVPDRSSPVVVGFVHPGYPTGQGYGNGSVGPPGEQVSSPSGYMPSTRPLGTSEPTISRHITDGSPNADGKETKSVLAFSDKSIRHGFIRKVYGILTLQMILTVGVIALFMYVEEIRMYVQSHTEIVTVMAIVSLVMIIALVCSNTLRRTSPFNYIALAIFTFVESFLLGVIATAYDSDVVLMAAGLTLVVFVALTIFAFQTKIDFTMCSGALFMMIIVLLVLGIMAAIFPSKTLNMVYASLGIFLACLYLIFDTQRMIGGNHSSSISPEEYIFAALCLYLDIVRIFLYILRLCKRN